MTEAEESLKKQLQDEEHMRRQEPAEMGGAGSTWPKRRNGFTNMKHEELMKLLAMVCEHWEASPQNWAEKQKELGEMIQKNNNFCNKQANGSQV